MSYVKSLVFLLLTLFVGNLLAAQPTKLFQINGAYDDAILVDNILFLAAKNAEGTDPDLRVFRLDNKGIPVVIGSYRSKDYAHSIAVKGQYLYLINGKFGLEVIDIGDPAKPQLVNFLPLDGYSHKVVIQNNLALVTSGFQGLHLIDISQPEQPVLVSTFQAYPPPEQSPTNDDASPASSYGGEEDYDNQREASGGGDINVSWEDLITVEGALDVAIQDQYAYIAYGSEGIVIADISNPDQVVKVNTIPVQHTAESIFYHQQTLYVTLGLNGIRLINVANPKAPKDLARIAGRCYATDVSVANNKVFLADGLCADNSLYTFDISDSRHPRKLESFSDRVNYVKLFKNSVLTMGPNHAQAFALQP